MNNRKAIRAKVAEILEGNVFHKSVAVRVVANKVTPLLEKDLPVISIYTFNEPADDKITAPRRYYRTPELSVQVILEAENGRVLDNDIDDITVQIEALLFKDPTFAEVIDDSMLRNTAIAIRDEGKRLLGSAILQFEVEYQDESVVISEDDPLDDLETADTEIKINNSATSKIEAQQDLTGE